MKKILLLLAILLVTITSCQAAEEPSAWMVNHVMASKIDYVQGTGFIISGPTNIKFLTHTGTNSAITKFTTLDQLLFFAGEYKIDIKIVEDTSGNVVANASHNSFHAQRNNVNQSFLSNWTVNTKTGLYTYQLFVNNNIIASYKIYIEAQ